MKDYPTSSELKKIRNWDILTSKKLMALLDYLKERWENADCGFFELTGKNVLRLRLSRAGSSSNSELIEALKKNLFWFCFWQKSLRGGHHFFKINLKESYPKEKEDNDD